MTLPTNPYVLTELQAFAHNRAEFLTSIGPVLPAMKRHFALTLMAKVSMLPPELQVILVEGKGDITIAPPDKLEFEQDILGSFCHLTGDIRETIEAFEGDRYRSAYVFQHEVGHKVSYASSHYAGSPLSSQMYWNTALTRQRITHAKMSQGDRLELTNRLYNGAWDLLHHLAKPQYAVANYAEEAAAEMLKHYSVLYWSGGTQPALAKLAQVYPALAEPFGTTFLPQVTEKAAAFYKARTTMVSGIADSFSELERRVGVTQGGEAARLQASIALIENPEKAMTLSFLAAMMANRMGSRHAFEDVFPGQQAQRLRRHFPTAPHTTAADFLRHVGTPAVLDNLYRQSIDDRLDSFGQITVTVEEMPGDARGI